MVISLQFEFLFQKNTLLNYLSNAILHSQACQNQTASGDCKKRAQNSTQEFEYYFTMIFENSRAQQKTLWFLLCYPASPNSYLSQVTLIFLMNLNN